MILHIHRNLLAGLAMQHRKRGPHLYFRISARAEECTYDTILGIRAPEVVIENGEEGHRVNCYISRGAPRMICICF